MEESAIERVMRLAQRVYVPPHYTVREGKKIQVDGYYRANGFGSGSLTQHSIDSHNVPTKRAVDAVLKEDRSAVAVHTEAHRNEDLTGKRTHTHTIEGRSTDTANMDDAVQMLDKLEEGGKYYRVTDTQVQRDFGAKGSAKITWNKDDGGTWHVVTSPGQFDGPEPKHDRGFFDTLQEAIARVDKHASGKGVRGKLMGLSEESPAVDKLFVALSMSVYVPPYIRVKDGKRQNVDGYFKKINRLSELSTDERRAIAQAVPPKTNEYQELDAKTGKMKTNTSSDDTPARNAFFYDDDLVDAIRNLNAKQGSEPPELNLKTGKRQQIVDAVQKAGGKKKESPQSTADRLRTEIVVNGKVFYPGGKSSGPSTSGGPMRSTTEGPFDEPSKGVPAFLNEGSGAKKGTLKDGVFTPKNYSTTSDEKISADRGYAGDIKANTPIRRDSKKRAMDTFGKSPDERREWMQKAFPQGPPEDQVEKVKSFISKGYDKKPGDMNDWRSQVMNAGSKESKQQEALSPKNYDAVAKGLGKGDAKGVVTYIDANGNQVTGVPPANAYINDDGMLQVPQSKAAKLKKASKPKKGFRDIFGNKSSGIPEGKIGKGRS